MLTEFGRRGHLFGIGIALSCMVLVACSSSPKEQPPRTLSELLGQSGQELSGRPTKTELTAGSLVRMGAQLESQGDYSGAMRFYTQAAQMEPNNIAALTGIGNIYLAVGVWNAGLNAFQQVRALDPRSPETASGLVVALLLNERPGEARQVLNRQMAMTGASLELQNLLGLAEDLLGNHGAAQSAYSTALELRPGDPEVLTNLALSFALAGAYERAEGILQRGAGTAEAIPLAAQNLALVYALRGRLAQAVAAARRELSAAQVEENTRFYERLPKLSAQDRARAVFFGTLPPEPKTPTTPAREEPTPALTPPVKTPEPKATEVPEPKIEQKQLPQEPLEQPPAEEPEVKKKPRAPEVTEPEPKPQPGAKVEVEPPEVTPKEPEVLKPTEKQPEPTTKQKEKPEAKVLEPEIPEPKVIEPEVKKPEAKEPEAKEPEAKEPEAQKPETPEPKVVEPEAKEPEVTDAKPELGPYWVQIGSYRYADQIRAGWATLNSQHGAALEEVIPYAQRYDGGERGIFWRLLTSPAGDRAIAQGDCELLLYAGLECFVLRTSGDIRPLTSDLKD